MCDKSWDVKDLYAMDGLDGRCRQRVCMIKYETVSLGERDVLACHGLVCYDDRCMQSVYD